MTHEELKQKVFSLAKNLEGIYQIDVKVSTRFSGPKWKEVNFYRVELCFEPWDNDNIGVEAFTPEDVISELENAISKPNQKVIEQLINAKVF